MGFKLFGMQFGAQNNAPEKQEFNVMSGNIFPCGDLSKPFINDRYRGNGGYIFFGYDNLFPQMMTQLYYTSPLHSAICNFKRNIVAGNGFMVNYNTADESAKMKIAQAGMNRWIEKNALDLALNLIIHKKMYVRLRFAENKFKSAHLIDPCWVRHDEDVNLCYINKHWEYTTTNIVLPVFDHSKYQEDCVLVYNKLDSGLTVYSLPNYSAANNWMFLAGEMSYFHKSAIINGINPGVIVSVPFNMTKEERLKLEESFRHTQKGAANANRASIFESPNKELMPEFTTVDSSQNDKQFLQTSVEAKEAICFAHEINPAIIGIKVNSSLGNPQELKASYSIFEQNVIKPLRRTLEIYIDEIMQISGLNGTVTFNNTELKFD